MTTSFIIDQLNYIIDLVPSLFQPQDPSSSYRIPTPLLEHTSLITNYSSNFPKTYEYLHKTFETILKDYSSDEYDSHFFRSIHTDINKYDKYIGIDLLFNASSSGYIQLLWQSLLDLIKTETTFTNLVQIGNIGKYLNQIRLMVEILKSLENFLERIYPL